MKIKTKSVVLAAVIAAMYICLTYLSSALGLAYGPIQFRISEALIMFSAFSPTAVTGLTIGCFISNLGSPYGFIDILLGTAATFLASVICYLLNKRFKKSSPFLFPIITAVINAFAVGLEVAIFTPESSFLIVFFSSALEVGIGELAVCYALGIPLYFQLKKHLNF